jgi:hypothetical protein
VSHDLGKRAFDWISGNAEALWSRSRRPGVGGLKLLSDVALAAGAWPDRDDARALLARAWDEAGRGERILSLVAGEPMVVTTYLPFVLVGLRSRELDERLAETRWRADYDRWPLFGQLAVGMTLQAIGLTPPWSMAARVVTLDLFDPPRAGRTSRPRQCELLAFTVMWHTRMGRRPSALGPATTARFRTAARRWTALLLEHELWGPLAQIAVASCCVGGPPPAAAMARLHAAQRADGGFDDDQTTFVAAMLGKLARREVAPLAVTSSELAEYAPEAPAVSVMFAD